MEYHLADYPFPCSEGFLLFVDDIRHPTEYIDTESVTVVARDYDNAIEIIQHCSEHGIPVRISLDHDLGSEKSGYDICKYIVEHNILNVRYRIHSMNPVGRDNMEQLLSHYGYKRF